MKKVFVCGIAVVFCALLASCVMSLGVKMVIVYFL
jgi:hypothetical protein